MKQILLMSAAAACIMSAIATPSLAQETQPAHVKPHGRVPHARHYVVQPVNGPSAEVLEMRRRGEEAWRIQEQAAANGGGGRGR